ncbi:MAG: hypothetical protein SPH82_01835 [Eubacteriales bacterium]|nr:hypothetical protein [Eubacteriales bacterium]
MNQRLMRLTAALFPLAGLIAAAAGGGALPLRLMLLYYALQLCTLCAVDCFRNGAARESGVRRVDRRFGGGITQFVLGTGLLLAALLLCPVLKCGFSAGLFAAVGCVTLEQMFEERIYALGRRVDGAVLSGIANLLLLAGLLLDAAGGIEFPLALAVEAPFTLAMAALGMCIAVLTAYIVERGHGFSLKPVNLARAPAACVQTLLYPAALTGLWIAAHRHGWKASGTGTALFYGLILWRLSRTVCRRTGEESRPLNLLLVTLMALPTAIGAVFPELTFGDMPMISYAAAAALAALCAGVVFCAAAWRYWLGFMLVLAADALNALHPLPEVWNMAAACALCLAAVVLNLHRAFLRRAKRPEVRF